MARGLIVALWRYFGWTFCKFKFSIEIGPARLSQPFCAIFTEYVKYGEYEYILVKCSVRVLQLLCCVTLVRSYYCFYSSVNCILNKKVLVISVLYIITSNFLNVNFKFYSFFKFIKLNRFFEKFK